MRVGARLLRPAVAATALLAPMLHPAAALAHAGRTNQVASPYDAVVSSVPAGVAVQVVDGDQRLWMSVNPRLTVIVVGLDGEPYLRFSRAGVAENVHSPTVYLNRAIPSAPPEPLRARARPAWRLVTTAHAYLWHEDRLHALALAPHPTGRADLGRWVVPLVVDGRREQVAGRLWQRPPPTLLWFWPLVVAVVIAAALVRVGDVRLDRRVAVPAGLLTMAAVVTGRIGRELLGHPAVSAWQVADMAATIAVAAGLTLLLARARTWRAGALLAAAAGLYQGLVLAPTLTQGYVFSALPAAVERAAAAAALAGGGGLLLVMMLVEVITPARRDEPAVTSAVAEPEPT
jgi:hypothetical protein